MKAANLRLIRGKSKRPRSQIAIRLRRPGGRWRRTHAFLDTAACATFFNAATMKALGIKRLKGTGRLVTDWSGRVMRYRIHPVEVTVGPFTVKLNACFSPLFRDNVNVLGLDFFSLFRITFDISKMMVQLEKKYQRRG